MYGMARAVRYTCAVHTPHGSIRFPHTLHLPSRLLCHPCLATCHSMRIATYLHMPRSPCLDLLIKGPLEKMAARAEHVPLLGSVMDYGVGLLSTFTEYYTYTSGSR